MYRAIPTPRRVRSTPTATAAVGVVLAGLFAMGLGLGQSTDFSWLTAPFTGARDAAAARASRPVHVSIPSIGVNAEVQPVGLLRDGSIAVPALAKTNTTGWYDRGPAPGDQGPAVLVGHVDDKRGPSVFYRLGTLLPGATVQVTRKDRVVVTFRVDSVRQYAKDALPIGPVFADFSRPALRLITCGGAWVGGRTGYADNIVVFASLPP
jgi:sortase family protein